MGFALLSPIYNRYRVRKKILFDPFAQELHDGVAGINKVPITNAASMPPHKPPRSLTISKKLFGIYCGKR